MGGRVSAESALGEGSQFSFSLQVASPAPDPPADELKKPDADLTRA